MEEEKKKMEKMMGLEKDELEVEEKDKEEENDLNKLTTENIINNHHKFDLLESCSCAEILVSCEVFIRNNWNLSSQPIIRLYQNPHIMVRNSPIYKKFAAALIENEMTLHDDNYIFGWHGTHPKNVVSICRDGFDVYRRMGQQHGVGEYFGTSCGISHGKYPT